MSPQAITLTAQEIEALTAYKRPADQLRALHAQGYWRAHRASTGRVILERAHYLAVSEGRAAEAANRPRVRPVLNAA